MYKIVKYGFLGLLIASPLMFGSVYLWATGIIELWVLTLTILWLWTPGHNKGLIRVRQHWPFLLLAIFLTLIVIQTIPWPNKSLEFVAPNNAQAWANLDLLGVSRSSFTPLSLTPHATLHNGLKWFCYTIAAWLAFSLASSRPGRKNNDFIKSVACTIAFTGALISLIAIIQLGLGLDAIYGFFKPHHSDTFLGPYVSKNHFAGYLEMALPLGIGLLGAQMLKGERTHHIRSGSLGRIELILLLSLSLTLMLTAILLSMSRAGTTIGLVLIICQLLLILRIFFRFLLPKKLFIAGFALVIAIITISTLTDWHKLEQRYSALPIYSITADTRYIVYSDTLTMTNHFPLFGSGSGSFQNVYPNFSTWKPQYLIQHTHNDYLEISSEMGYLGLAVMLIFFGYLLYVTGKTIKQVLHRASFTSSQSTFFHTISTGFSFGCLAILLHSFVDFNLQIPANALTFFIICGILISINSNTLNEGS